LNKAAAVDEGIPTAAAFVSLLCLFEDKVKNLMKETTNIAVFFYKY